MNKDPGEVLNSARNSFKKEDYPDALEKYIWFFENSTVINKAAYTGVRRSYCLGEWADLASIYPPALETLIAQKNTSINGFKETKSIDNFRDSAAICYFLNCMEEVIILFKEVYKDDKELSKKLFSSVFEYLARNKEWGICREYLGDCTNRYIGLIELFDVCIQFANKRGGETGIGVEKDAIEKTKEEFIWLLNINLYANDKSGYTKLLEKLRKDLATRGYNELYDEISGAAPAWPD